MRKDPGDGLPDNFRRTETIKSFSTHIPTDDGAVKGLANDGVVAGFHQESQDVAIASVCLAMRRCLAAC